jgi:hypothetical protein
VSSTDSMSSSYTGAWLLMGIRSGGVWGAQAAER